MADDIVDLTLDDSSDDEVAQRPAKRSRPLVPEADGSDEVILVEDACEASPATEAAPAGTGELQDGEELRITDSSLEVWNQDLPHQRHQCGRHSFTKAASVSNKQACSNCYCFVCDKVASECSSWGTGAVQTDHCNSYPDPVGLYSSLRRHNSATAPARGDAGLSSMLPNLDTPAPGAGLQPPDVQRLMRRLHELSTPYCAETQRPAPQPTVEEELPPPGGPDMIHLGEVRLRCKVRTPGATLAELDGKLLRNGIYTGSGHTPGDTLHIGSLFSSASSANWNMELPGHSTASSPSELMPFDLPPAAPVPPERVVPITVFHCDGSSGPPMTYGVEINCDTDKTLKHIVTKAKQVIGLIREPFSSFLYGQPRHEGMDFSLDGGMTFLSTKNRWNANRPLVTIIPAVAELCQPTVLKKPKKQARLLVYLYVPADGTEGQPGRSQLIGPPIAFMVTVDLARGGSKTDGVVQNAIRAALRPFLKPGRMAPSIVLKDCTRCHQGGGLNSARLPFSRRVTDLPDVLGRPAAFMAASLTSAARASYDLSKLTNPAVHPTAAPEVLAVSHARRLEVLKQKKAKEQAQAEPAAVHREMVSAQCCSKPYEIMTERQTKSARQVDTPSLRVRLNLEPDQQDPSRGTAVFQLWTWKAHSASPLLNRPAHNALIPHSATYNLRSTCLGISGLSQTVRRMLLQRVPGLTKADEAMQHWSDSKMLKTITSVPTLLNALETGEIEAAAQPPGLTVALRPYQLQTLGFMQRAESGEDGMRRHIWFPVPETGTAGTEPQKHAWWYSPVFKVACLQEPPRSCWGGFLGETMGLGKTVEVLALILSDRAHQPSVPKRLATLYPRDHSMRRKEQQQATPAGPGPEVPEAVAGRLCSNATLVVCAVSLVGQWVTEAQSKAGGALRIYQYHGQGRSRDARALALEYDVVVTTYATLGSDWRAMSKLEVGDSVGRQRQAPLHAVQWYRLVMDESHCAKDAASGQTKACVALEASRRWCCSGTPLATETMDLAGQLAALRMPPFSDKAFFAGRYKRALMPESYLNYRENYAMPELLYLLSCIMVRHTGTQTTGGETVLALPPLQRDIVEVAFSPGEAAMYRTAHDAAVVRFKSYLATIPGNPAAAASKHLLGIMSLLLPLRRIASGGELSVEDVSLPAPTAVVSESHKLEGGTVALPAQQMQCSVCLDAPDTPTRTPCGHWFCRECIVGALERASGACCPMCRAAVDVSTLQAGVTTPKAAEASAAGAAGDDVPPDAGVACDSKLRTLVAELHAMRASDSGAKALVFSQFSSTIEWLKLRLPGEGFAYRTIDGGMPMRKRAAAIADFQGDPPTTVFLLSMRAGAVGINLTAASHVFLLEPALNPSLEEQAIGRAWRMGQTRSVVVKRFFVKGTVEANIMELNKRRADGNSGDGAASGQSTNGGAGPSDVRRGGKILKQQEVVGSVHTDRQNLKLGELDLLFQKPTT